MLIRFSLYGNHCYVLHGLDMTHSNTVMAGEIHRKKYDCIFSETVAIIEKQ